MRLVAVSIIKNEADVIEAFVRHTATWVDAHLIFDHASTDGTREILAALAREGLPVKLFTDDEVGNQQQARNNRLVKIAVEQAHADWVIPLDADEFIVAPDRAALEAVLAHPDRHDRPLSLFMGNYFPHPADPTDEPNPALRLTHRVAINEGSKKIFLPRSLGLDPEIVVAKGSHSVSRGATPIADTSAPDTFWLAHIPQRSVSQQMMRVITAHLQKVSAGQEQASVDIHYAPLYRFMSRSPELFPATLETYPDRVHRHPIPYRGGPLTHTNLDWRNDWPRTLQALLPFLESLAHNHGRLKDLARTSAPAAPTDSFRALPLRAVAKLEDGFEGGFFGFTCPQGLGPPEGPFTVALLPRFRWGMAPSTVLDFFADEPRTGCLEWIALSQFGDQTVHVECNGVVLTTHVFTKTHLQEKFSLPLPVVAGSNRVVLHYEKFVVTDADPRQLAVPFMSLRIW